MTVVLVFVGWSLVSRSGPGEWTGYKLQAETGHLGSLQLMANVMAGDGRKGQEMNDVTKEFNCRSEGRRVWAEAMKQEGLDAYWHWNSRRVDADSESEEKGNAAKAIDHVTSSWPEGVTFRVIMASQCHVAPSWRNTNRQVSHRVWLSTFIKATVLCTWGGAEKLSPWVSSQNQTLKFWSEGFMG